MFKRFFLLVLIFPMLCSANQKEYIFPFHSFDGGLSGSNPRDAGLLIIGDYIYGTTYSGGLHNAGTIYRIRKGGGEHKVLHQFKGNTDTVPNGNPRGRLTYDGERIYGICTYFSGNYGGAVYSIKPDGSEYRVLADFYDGTGSFINGKFPVYGGVTLINGVLYGATSVGGNGDNGVLFSLNKDGSNFKVFYKFPSDKSLGANCYSGLEYKNGRFYGATATGGENSAGTIFSIKPDGTDMKVLKHLAGSTEGYQILSPLLIVENTIYITPVDGGIYDKGTIISIRTDGTDFKVLHHFNVADGGEPGVYGGLTVIGGYLYGVTKSGGGSNEGVFYRIKRDGTDFTVLDYFDSYKGSYYKGSAVFEAPYLYGSTYGGGTSGAGTLWAYYVGFPIETVTYIPEFSLTTAKLWGNAYEKDGFKVQEKGFCWGLNPDPGMEDNVAVVGSGPGKFVADIYQLLPGKTYHVRAWSKNKMGIFYGKCVSFRSPHPKVSGTITLNGNAVSGVTVDFVGREIFVTGPSGTFSAEVYYGWSGTVRLSKEGYTFSPAEYRGVNLKENCTLEFICTKNQ